MLPSRALFSCLPCAAILLAGPPAMAQVPASPAAVFESTTLLRDVSLSAPLSDLFLRTQSAIAKRDVGSGKPSLPTVKGLLRIVNAAGATETFENVVVEPRGNSSLLPGQCTFSKLTLKFPKSTKGTSLGGLKTIKLGTHCGERDVHLETWDRIGNERPIREVLAYTVLRRVGVVSLLARLSRSRTGHEQATQRGALAEPAHPQGLLRGRIDIREALRRKRGAEAQDVLDGPPDAGDRFKDATSSQIDPANVALALFSEALLDNIDYFVRLWSTDSAVGALEGFTNYNVNIITDKNKHRLIEVYDWDTAGWVTGPIDPKSARFPAVLARVRATFHDDRGPRRWGQSEYRRRDFCTRSRLPFAASPPAAFRNVEGRAGITSI